MSKAKQGLGWFYILMLIFSSSAWGLDHDRVIGRMEAESVQILSTLGRDKGLNQATSSQTHKLVQVRLVKRAKVRKHR